MSIVMISESWLRRSAVADGPILQDRILWGFDVLPNALGKVIGARHQVLIRTVSCFRHTNQQAVTFVSHSI